MFNMDDVPVLLVLGGGMIDFLYRRIRWSLRVAKVFLVGVVVDGWKEGIVRWTR